MLIPILVLSIPLLIFPLFGLRSTGKLEDQMVTKQENFLTRLAGSLSKQISDQIRPALQKEPVKVKEKEEEEPVQKPEYARLSGTMQLDGFNTDWPAELISPRLEDKTNPESLSYHYYSGIRGQYLYLLFQVRDDKVIYRDTDTLLLDENDHLQIIVLNGEEKKKYITAGYKPGWIVGFDIPDQPEQIAQIEKRIHGVWKSADNGYTLEVRIDRSLLGDNFSLAIADVDDIEARSINALVDTLPPTEQKDPETPLAESVESFKPLESVDLIEILNATDIDLLNYRVRIIDNDFQILAEAGKLAGMADAQAAMNTGNTTGDQISNINGIQGALNGQNVIVHYQNPQMADVITAAFAPVQNNGEVVALLSVEQTIRSVLSPIKDVTRETILLFVTAFLISSGGICLYLFRASRGDYSPSD